HIRTDAEVTKIEIDRGRAIGVQLATGETLTADQIIVSAGAIFSPALLMRSGIGPLEHLQDHDISVHADLPVGETLSDHLGPGLQYQHAGPRGGTAGPAQSLLVGSSNGSDVDYHLFTIATAPSEAQTNFMMAAFLMRSSGQGSVRLGDSPDAAPVVMAPPMPQDTVERLRPGFSRIAAWEQSDAFAQLNCQRLEPLDLNADDAVSVAMERNLVSYGHMTSSCPMGRVLDADCRVLGIHGLRVVDASVMPSIPSGNTYLGCVMVAERVARKIKSNMD
ncbi:MAG: GMC family oxidoreductase, partial [Pseudomonadota bacterium]